jgi:hypothetical protein
MTTTITEPLPQVASRDPTEMLIKEARQLQRRQHRRRWTLALVLAAVIAMVSVVASNGGRHLSPGSALNSQTSSRSSTGGRADAAAPGRMLQAEEMDVAGPSEVIVGNFQGVFRTIDGGHHWINITPPVITSQPVLLSHLDKILSTHGNRIWLELDGDARTTFTAYSSSGGMSWAVLKDSVSAPPSPPTMNDSRSLRKGHVPKGLHIQSVYVASPSLAWAQATGPAIGIFTPTYLLRTTSGGESWTAVRIPKR